MGFNSPSIPSFNLGNGVAMPAIGLGTWQCSDEEVKAAVLEALRVGYRHFDTAWLYMCEKGVGQGIKEWIAAGGDREELCVVTKLPPNANRAKDVERLLNKQLANLGLDYVDLYLVHSPQGWINNGDDLDIFTVDECGFANFDYETDLVGLWAEMEKMVGKGKARTIGVSNFNQKQIENILASCSIQPVINQVEVHAYFSNTDIVDFCKSKGINVCAYAPLGSPARGKLIKDTPPLNVLEDPVVIELSKRYSKSPAQILLRHHLHRGIITIPKSDIPQQLQENINILSFELSEDDIWKMDKINRNQRFFTMRPPLPTREGKDHPEYPF